MSVSFELVMQPRNQVGTAASRRLRRLEGKVPVILYGNGVPSIALSVDHSLLARLAEDDAFYSSILKIQAGDMNYQAILKGLKWDPVKPLILDADFLRVDEKKLLHLSVPLHFLGENIAPGVKQGGGIVSYQLNTVELSCLPKDIPAALTIDISHLGVGEPIMLSQLTLPDGVSLTAKEDRVVVTILAPRGQSTTNTSEASVSS
jgi:large subunit ribosomal protein L25